MRVSQLQLQLRFTIKSGQHLGVVHELVGKDLDRHLPGEVRVLGALNFARPALTELFRDAVVRERWTDHGVTHSYSGKFIRRTSS